MEFSHHTDFPVPALRNGYGNEHGIRAWNVRFCGPCNYHGPTGGVLAGHWRSFGLQRLIFFGVCFPWKLPRPVEKIRLVNRRKIRLPTPADERRPSSLQIRGMRGLSGNISFDQFGVRSNYTVDIVEVTVNSELTTVSWPVVPNNPEFAVASSH